MALKAKLTKRYLDALKPQDAELFIWDEDLTGYGARIAPSGRITLFVQYRTANGRQRRVKVGVYDQPLTADKARAEAKSKLATVVHGGDLGGEREAARRMMTIDGFWTDYYLPDAERRHKERTLDENRRRWDLHIKPALGGSKLDSLVVGDVRKLHQAMGANPIGANRVLALLRSLFNKALDWGLLPEGHPNPAARVKPFPEKSCERFLDLDELGRLGKALDQAEASGSEPLRALLAIRLLALSGCRRDEILGLEWAWIDFERGALDLPDSKSGKKTVWLNVDCLALLERLREIRTEGNPYVIEGYRHGTRLVGVHRIWDRLRKAAGLDGVRLHDLRHTAASQAVMGGVSLSMVAKMLGHSTTRMSERYAHLSANPVQLAIEQVGGTIAKALREGTGGAKVVEIGAAKEEESKAAKGGA